MSHIAPYRTGSWTSRQDVATAIHLTMDGMTRRVIDDDYRLPKPKPGTMAARIVTAMQKEGVRTPARLSVLTGINRQTIHRWFAESADMIDPKKLYLVADALHTAGRWLALGVGPMQQPRTLTDDEAAILELAANLDKLQDGSRDLWIRDGIGRLEQAKVRASKSNPYPAR